MDEQSRPDREDRADEGTLISRHKSVAENGWIPQGLDEMNPKYKNKFLKSNSAEKVDKALLETSWKPQELDNLNSKFKDNILKKNGIADDGKKNESPMKRFKKKITRSHGERQLSKMTHELNPENEETKKKIEPSDNETSEIKVQSKQLECDEGGTPTVRQDSGERLQTVASEYTVELETNDQLRMIKEVIASNDMNNTISRPESSVEKTSSKLKKEEINQISGSSTSSRKDSSKEPEAKFFCAKFSYETRERGEISFSQGEVMEVIRKAQNGWWLVNIGQRKGWAPSNFLVPISLSRRRGNGVNVAITRNTGQQLQTDSSESELARTMRQRKTQLSSPSSSTESNSQNLQTVSFESELARNIRQRKAETSSSSSSTGSNPQSVSPFGSIRSSSEQNFMVPNDVFRDDSPVNVMVERNPTRFSSSNSVSPSLKGNSPHDVFFNSEPSQRNSPRQSPSDLCHSISPRSLSLASETCDACLSRSASPSPRSSNRTRNQETRRQLPSLPADTLNIKGGAQGIRYQCDPVCMASHANDEQEILNVTSEDLVEVLYQDRRGYSLVRIPSKYGWVPTTCITRIDSAS